MSERVLLLHGIWMRGFSLWRLRRWLRERGFEPECLEYASILGGTERAVRRIARRVEVLGREGPVHLVGHSLGGLVALEAIRRAPQLPFGRVVCLGSPLNGSRVARRLGDWPGTGRLLGRSGAILLSGIEHWDGLREVGVIAGSLPFGLGAMVGPLARPHDGTVAVAETRLAGISDHRIVPASHTGLLLSREAADLTAGFLHHGRFA